MKMTELIYYRGNCHCGAVVYEFKLPKITTVDRCHCSICLKKGYLLVYPGAESEFKILKGEDALTEYRFHTNGASHQVCLGPGFWVTTYTNTFEFCSTCATPLFRVASEAPLGKNLAVNVRNRERTGCITRLLLQRLIKYRLIAFRGSILGNSRRTSVLRILFKLKYDTNQIRIDGASLGEKYPKPAHKGSLPTVDFQGGKTYTGSCHCGALTVAIVSKPLENNPDVRLAECNCSICERVYLS